MIKIANAQLWVHDQDEALAFYTDKLGMEVRTDVTLPEMNFRWLAVGRAGQPDAAAEPVQGSAESAARPDGLRQRLRQSH